MAGLGTALAYAAAGMAEGWGKGQMDAIKQTREEKLRQLELDRAERMEGQRQKFQGEQSAMDRAQQAKLAGAQLAATKENTMAQLGVQERIAKMGEESATERAKMGNKSAEDIATAGRATQEKIAQLSADTTLTATDKQIGANQALETARIDAARELGTEMVKMEDGSVKMRQGSKYIEMPNDPKTGKPMSPAIAKEDTNEVANMKYLMSLGVPQQQAQQLAFGKDTDPVALQAGIYKSILDARSDFDPTPSDEDLAKIQAQAKAAADAMSAGRMAPQPGVPSSATTAPTGKPPKDQAISSATDAAKRATPEQKAAIRQRLIEWGYDPAEAGL